MKIAKLAITPLSILWLHAWADPLPPSLHLQQAQVEKTLNTWRARSGIPAAAVSVYLADQRMGFTVLTGTTLAGGSEKITENALFQAGSITKSFTSAIVLQLEAEGKLNIDDPITRYLPQYPHWQHVTIRELLNHSSGIFNYTETAAFNIIRKTRPQAEITPEEIVQMASQHHGYFAPGHGWKYSNTNYVLAGMIVEKVTGQSMTTVTNRFLHHPPSLNLANTYYLSGIYSPTTLAHMAHGYNSEGVNVTTDNMSWANSAGAIVSTSQDLVAWWRSLFANHLLPPQQLNEMMTLICKEKTTYCSPGETRSHIGMDAAGKGYGLGIIQTGYGSSRVGTVWWHNGSTRGYKAVVMWFPKSNVYLSLMINRDPGYLLKPNLALIQRILRIMTAGPGEVVASEPVVSHHKVKKRTRSHKRRHHKHPVPS